MNAIQSKVVRLPLDAITVDDELQPRAKMDKETWQEYAFLLSEGVSLPPVIVVAEPGKLWLADGYHRLFAHRSLDMPEIEAEVRRGTFADALRISLAANATHGKQRTKGDYTRAYGIAVNHDLVDPADADSVMQVLHCSIRWARDLTGVERGRADARRYAETIAAMDRGERQADVAVRLGVDQATISRVWRAEKERRSAAEAEEYAKRQGAEMHNAADTATEPAEPAEPSDETEPPPLLAYIAQVVAEPDDEPDDDPDHVPVSVSAAELPDEATRLRAGMAEIESPEVRMWHDALEALRAINRLKPPDVLFANRYHRFDHLFGPELQAAFSVSPPIR
jgi:transcriptional regulator with XRE-family HTH domain